MPEDDDDHVDDGHDGVDQSHHGDAEDHDDDEKVGCNSGWVQKRPKRWAAS